MSALPNCEQAIIPLEKLAGYSLNPEHPTGKHKARVFQSALGLTQGDAELLRDKIHEVICSPDAYQATSSDFGDRYVIEFNLTTDVGIALVRTTWIVRFGEDFPRLTSCYVIKDE